MLFQKHKIPALFVDSKGPYFRRADVDPWDRHRDATQYAGPYPVVSHPPCGPWGRYHHRCFQDPKLALIALEQVRTFKGVLEHPVDSKLWKAGRMPYPNEFPDRWGGFTVEVHQGWWGHRAQKPTWLYVVGLNPSQLQRPAHKPKATELLENLAKSKRHITPGPFADFLISLVRKIGE